MVGIDFSVYTRKIFIEHCFYQLKMETVTIPKGDFNKLEQENKKLKNEIEVLRNTKLYKRLLMCLENLKKKEYTREDLGI